jgi:hypothetical protein
MKIGIISDTHDEGNNIRKAVAYFNGVQAQAVLFAGDLATPSALFFFQEIKCPIHAVYGNNEGDQHRIFERIERIGLDWHYDKKEGSFLDLTFDNIHFGLYHGNSRQITAALVKSRLYDVIVTGHTHEAHITQDGPTLWVNPGTSSNYATGSFSGDPTIAVYDTAGRTAEIIHLKDQS